MLSVVAGRIAEMPARLLVSGDLVERTAIAEDVLSLGDRLNMAFLGTVVTHGRGTGIVVATGMRTELGRIAGLLQTVPTTATPLQQRLDATGRHLAAAGAAAAAGVRPRRRAG